MWGIEIDYSRPSDENSALSSLSGLNWFALSANTEPFYYDIFALRCQGWVEDDCFNAYQELIQHGMSDRLAKRVAIGSKQIPIREVEQPFVVGSAFNGLALYKAKFHLQGSYIAEGTTVVICEHVVFNRRLSLLSSGSSMYVVPRLVIGKTSGEHIFRAEWKALWYGLLHRFFKKWMWFYFFSSS